MSEQALTSLAILTVNWDRGHDAIESFVPIVAECLRENGTAPVSALALQRSVKRDFGLTIPMGALEAILGRCARHNYVRLEHKVYVPIPKNLDKLDFGPKRAEALRQHACVLNKLRSFAKERYDLDWSEDDADAALLGYLQESSFPVLAAATEGDPLPTPAKQSRRTKHVMSAFAGHLDEADPDGFECLVTVVKGHVLSTVLFYPDLGQVQTRFVDLDVYFDTPFLLPAIGYGEEGLTVQCVETLELLRGLGANLRCFHHTEEEVAGVLDSEAARLRGSSDEPADYRTSRPFNLHEIEELLIELPKTLSKLGIDIVDTPTWTDAPDEIALDEAVEKAIHYYREKAREKDVKSLAAVYRLREGRRMGRFESAKAIFVTRNTRLVGASCKFFRDVEGRGGVPICMSVTLVTRLAWVKKPMAAPDLPSHLVIASSYAALNPSDVLWREYLARVAERLEKGEISDEDYHFLRWSREARQALMDVTLGDDEAFTAGTLDEVVAHARAQIQAEAKAETAAERDEKLAAQAEARTERGKREGIVGAHRSEVDRKARRDGAVVGWGVAALLVVAIIVGLLATAVPGIPLLDVEPLAWRIVVWVCIAVGLAVGLYVDLRKDMSVSDVRKAIASWVERKRCERGHRKLDEIHSRASREG